MKTFDIELEGITPLMHHRMPEETVMALLMGTKTKKKDVEQPKTPREVADRHVYRAKDGTFFIPTTYITGAFIEASSDYKQTSSSKKSLKRVAGGAFRALDGEATLIEPKTQVPVKDYEVDIKKGTNHLRGAVAICRPRFDRWKVKLSVTIDETIIPVSTAQQILTDAGRRVGIGSFRVSKGGFYGQFMITKWKETEAL